jgi:hypothetical protein
MVIFANVFISLAPSKTLPVQNTASPNAPEQQMNPDHGWLSRKMRPFRGKTIWPTLSKTTLIPFEAIQKFLAKISQANTQNVHNPRILTLRRTKNGDGL